MTRLKSTGIAYDDSLDALTTPGGADNFFRLHRSQSEAAWCAEFSRLAYCDHGRVLASSLAAVGFRRSRPAAEPTASAPDPTAADPTAADASAAPSAGHTETPTPSPETTRSAR